MKNLRRILNEFIEVANKNAIQDEEYFLTHYGKELTQPEIVIPRFIKIIESQQIKMIDDDVSPQELLDYISILDEYFGYAIDYMITQRMMELWDTGKYDDLDWGNQVVALITFTEFYTLLSHIKTPSYSYFMVKNKLDNHSQYPFFREG